MKRANGNIIIETEDKESANRVKNNWNDTLFGGSSCRLTKKRVNNEIVMKDVPLLGQMPRTGIAEDEMLHCIQEKYPRANIQRFKRRDGSPMHIVKVITETEEQAQDMVTNGFILGCLWIQVENLKPRNNQIIQCYKCLRLGHISSQCRFNQR